MTLTVGERIRAIRVSRQMTQRELGEKCGIAEPTIRRYELGGLNPKLSTIERIAVALDVSTAELAGLSEGDQQGPAAIPETQPSVEMSLEQKRAKKLLRFFSLLNDKGQQEAIKRLDELSQLPVYQSSPIPSEYKVIGKRIKKARERKQMSYEQLGEMCQLSSEDILTIESGNKIVPPDMAKFFAAALDIPMTDLLPLTPEEQEQVEKYYGFFKMLTDAEQMLPPDSPELLKFRESNKPMCDAANDKLAEICDRAVERLQADGLV